MRCRPATRATPMLNSSSIRLRRRESVSLGRFQNCNLLEMDHFRRHGVEDESGNLSIAGLPVVGLGRPGFLAGGEGSPAGHSFLGNLFGTTPTRQKGRAPNQRLGVGNDATVGAGSREARRRFWAPAMGHRKPRLE